MYVSDYGFAASPSAWTTALNNYDGNDANGTSIERKIGCIWDSVNGRFPVYLTIRAMRSLLHYVGTCSPTMLATALGCVLYLI